LPNDRRHNLKLFGLYAWDTGFQVGGSFWFQTGRPINGTGWHPSDPWARYYASTAWFAYSFCNGGEPCPRGCGGRTDDVWNLDLMLRYDIEAAGQHWNLRLDVFNLFANQAVTQVDDRAELSGVERPNPSYMQPRYFQSPRSVRLGVGLSF
jgi:outer membrane receptor protein involved in Fe transport